MFANWKTHRCWYASRKFEVEFPTHRAVRQAYWAICVQISMTLMLLRLIKNLQQYKITTRFNDVLSLRHVGVPHQNGAAAGAGGVVLRAVRVVQVGAGLERSAIFYA